MRRYTYIKQTNHITDTTTIQRMRISGMHYVHDILVSETDTDYLYCLQNAPESISDQDVTEEYFERRKFEVHEERKQQYRERVDDLTAELIRRQLILDITPEEETELKNEIARISQEIVNSLPYPVMPNY